MRGLTTLTRVEALLLLRQPAALFFTLLLPLLLLFLNDSAGPGDGGANGAVLEALVPGYLVYVMATAGLMALPEVLASYPPVRLPATSADQPAAALADPGCPRDHSAGVGPGGVGAVDRGGATRLVRRWTSRRS